MILTLNIKSMNLQSSLVFLQNIMPILVMTKECSGDAKKVVLNSMNMQLFVPLLLKSNISVLRQEKGDISNHLIGQDSPAGTFSRQTQKDLR